MQTEERPTNASRPPEMTAMLMVAAALAIGLGIGYTLGKNAATVPYSPQTETGTAPSLPLRVRTVTPEAGSAPPTSDQVAPGTASVLSLGGTITSIGESSITVDAPAPPGSKGWIAVREVRIDKSTVIVTLKAKDAATLRKEGGMPFEEIPSTFADLKTGEFITASAANGADLTNMARFVAAKIMASVPEAPPSQAVPPPAPK